MRWPITSNRGRHASKVGSSPPTITASVALRAPATPPDTGASSMVTPSSAARRASARTTSGEFVERSTITVPGRAPTRRPSLPVTTSSTSAGPGRETNTTAASPATAAGVSAQPAPSSRRFWALSRRRSWIVSERPACSRLAAIGLPMFPVPMKPMGASGSITTIPSPLASSLISLLLARH